MSRQDWYPAWKNRAGRVVPIQSTAGGVIAVTVDADDFEVRLIAAAPDLLEAARAMIDNAYVPRSKEYDLLRAAIAKAEGAS